MLSEAAAKSIREEPRFRGIEPIRSSIKSLEEKTAEYIGVEYGMAFSTGNGAMHRALGLEDWGMDPEVLEIGFERYPDVKIVIMSHSYGFPGQVDRIKEICHVHGALLIEDAGESLSATVRGKRTGSFGDYGVLSFSDNDLGRGIGGSILLLNDLSEAKKVRGENNGQTEEEARIFCSRMQCLTEFIARKRMIYGRYSERFMEDLMLLNPVGEGTEPNYMRPCMTVESGIGFIERRTEQGYEYIPHHGTAAPMEILDALAAFGVSGEPVRKPMHMQSTFRTCDQITLDGSKRDYESTRHNELLIRCNESADIFRKGIFLPADIGMTEDEQDRVIDIIFTSYSKREIARE